MKKHERERYWSKMVKGYGNSGLNQKEYCKQKGLALSTFQLWKRKIRLMETGEVLQPQAIENSRKRNRFIPVQVSGGMIPAWKYEITFTEGTQIRLNAGFDQNELQLILEAVQEVSVCS